MSSFISIAHAGVISDAPTISHVLYNVLQFLLGLFVAVAIIGFVIAGVWYLFSGGDRRNQERAKRALKFSIVGVIVTLGAYVVVNFFLEEIFV